MEPSSASEILSATHLFTVELTDLSATPWTPGTDGLEHRRLTLDLTLLETFKGHFDLQNGAKFKVEVPQRREDALTVSDFHGFWSHMEPEKGSRYLVLSKATNDNVAMLMQEPAIAGLSDTALSADVKLALTAEQRFAPALRPSQTPAQRQAAAVELLKFTSEKRADCRALFARYMWERVAPIYPDAENPIFTTMLSLIEAKDAKVELREALLYGIYDEVSKHPVTEEHRLQLVRSFLHLMLQPEAAPLHDRLLQVPLHDLLFEDGNKTLSAATVFPDVAERSKLKHAVDGFHSQKAKEIGSWLEGK